MNSLLPKNENKILKELSREYAKNLDGLPFNKISILPTNDKKKAIKEILPILANMFSVNISGIDDEPTARNLISKGFLIHKRKGTAWALKEAVKKHGSARVIEWFEDEYKGKPYNFKVDFSSHDKAITPKLINDIKKTIEENKNVRSHLEEIFLSYSIKEPLNKNSGGAVGETEMSAKSDDFFESTIPINFNNTASGSVSETEFIASYNFFESSAIYQSDIVGAGNVAEMEMVVK